MTQQNYGMNTAGGFSPAVPTTEDIMKRVFSPSSGLTAAETRPGNEHLQLSEATKRKQALLRAYAKVFDGAEGQMVLDDIMDQTLRRTTAHPGGTPSLEECTVYSLRRDGQNAIAVWMLAQLQAGIDLGKAKPPSRAKAKK